MDPLLDSSLNSVDSSRAALASAIAKLGAAVMKARLAGTRSGKSKAVPLGANLFLSPVSIYMALALALNGTGDSFSPRLDMCSHAMPCHTRALRTPRQTRIAKFTKCC